jgi:diacylglycerol kinase (ATP)
MNHRRLPAKLIFNPGSGVTSESCSQLMDVIRELQTWNILPQTCLVEPDLDISFEVKDALKKGIRMFVACGGDGTVNAIANSLTGTNATLGVIPTGTQNNIALSLGIPVDIPEAVRLLREGRRIKVDTGLVSCGNNRRSFLEVCSVGLIAALYPAADEIQHGNLARVGDFLTALFASPLAEMHLVLDGKQEITTQGHVVLVSNMPYFGPHYRISADASCEDGYLDILLFSELTKIDLLGYAVQGAAGVSLDNPRIKHYQVRQVSIETSPNLMVMADGYSLGEGTVTIGIQRQALTMMAGFPALEGPVPLMRGL